VQEGKQVVCGTRLQVQRHGTPSRWRLQDSHGLRAKPALECGSASYRLLSGTPAQVQPATHESTGRVQKN